VEDSYDHSLFRTIVAVQSPAVDHVQDPNGQLYPATVPTRRRQALSEAELQAVARVLF
jgi:hypothetical protein